MATVPWNNVPSVAKGLSPLTGRLSDFPSSMLAFFVFFCCRLQCARDVTTTNISCRLIAKYYSCQHGITAEFRKLPQILSFIL